MRSSSKSPPRSCNGMRLPDIIALQEVQDDSGAAQRWRGDVQGNARQLVDGDRRWRAVRPTARSTSPRTTTWTAGSPAATSARCSSTTMPASSSRTGKSADRPRRSPSAAMQASRPSVAVGRIDPTDPAAFDAIGRKPLIAEFIFNGESGIRDQQPFRFEDRRRPTCSAPINRRSRKPRPAPPAGADRRGFRPPKACHRSRRQYRGGRRPQRLGFSDSLEPIGRGRLTNLADLLPVNER